MWGDCGRKIFMTDDNIGHKGLSLFIEKGSDL
jgi:hypothetical protein